MAGTSGERPAAYPRVNLHRKPYAACCMHRESTSGHGEGDLGAGAKNGREQTASHLCTWAQMQRLQWLSGSTAPAQRNTVASSPPQWQRSASGRARVWSLRPVSDTCAPLQARHCRRVSRPISACGVANVWQWTTLEKQYAATALTASGPSLAMPRLPWSGC